MRIPVSSSKPVSTILITSGYTQHLNDQLFKAVKQNDVSRAELTIDRGADVNARDKFKRTPLIIAAFRGYTKLANSLISKGANIGAMDINGKTPILAAGTQGHSDIVALLITKGASKWAPPQYIEE